jgi:hypothetical protein
VLDTELESNQVQDVLKLLLRVRSTIRSAATSWFGSLLRRNRVLEAMTSDEGLHMSCAQVTLDRTSGKLRIVESYCPLIFSRVVRAYESKVSRFRDHRAFFYAAPRYALAAAAAILAPVLVAAFLGFPPGLIVATSVVAAGSLASARTSSSRRSARRNTTRSTRLRRSSAATKRLCAHTSASKAT